MAVMKISRIKQIKALGFDKSYHIKFTKSYHIECSQCEALCINGTPTHETGCPNEPGQEDEEEI